MVIMDKKDMTWDTIKKMMVSNVKDEVRECKQGNYYDKGKYGTYVELFTHPWYKKGIGPDLFVGFYSQTYDSAEGDIWEAEIWLADRVERNTYTQDKFDFIHISQKSSSNRFLSSKVFGAMASEARDRVFGKDKISDFEEEFKL